MQEERRGARLKNKLSFPVPFFFVVVLVFLIDQAAKLVIQNLLKLHQSIPVILGVFHITYIRNPGASFGLFPQFRLFFVFVAIVFVFLVIFFIVLEKPNLFTQIYLGLITGGAASNTFDRLVYGGVVDWLDFRIWPVFNLADVSIFVGAVILAYRTLVFFRSR